MAMLRQLPLEASANYFALLGAYNLSETFRI